MLLATYSYRPARSTFPDFQCCVSMSVCRGVCETSFRRLALVQLELRAKYYCCQHSDMVGNTCQLADRTYCQLADRTYCQLADRTYCQLADRTYCQRADRTYCQLADISLRGNYFITILQVFYGNHTVFLVVGPT